MTVVGAMAALAGRGASCGHASGAEGAPDLVRTYLPTLNSIRRHATPEWFHDVKFGMFIDFGLYSVPGYAPKREVGSMYPDWYLYNMYRDPEVMRYHKATWGESFQRDDFIPRFLAENYNPEDIVRTAESAGMRYVVPFCKHHDGFCLWPSSYTHRNAAEMGPNRDLIAPLSEACRARGLKFGFYFSLDEWEHPVLKDGKKMLRTWLSRYEAKHGEPWYQITSFDEAAMAGRITGKIPVRDFVADYIVPQAKEFIDRYDPDLLWLDGGWSAPVDQSGSLEIISHLYNRAAGRKDVATNDRLGLLTRYSVGDFFTSEYGSHDIERTQILHKWEECRGVSQSFGYNWQDTASNIVSTAEIIDRLVKIVSENGNLLLVVNLDGTGAMPGYIRERLRDVGRWLTTNGEAIYNSRPWYTARQGDRIRFTQSKDGRYLYAIHHGWPEAEVELASVLPDRSAKVVLLGSDRELPWRYVPVGSDDFGKGGKLIVSVPELLRREFESAPAVTLRVQLTD